MNIQNLVFVIYNDITDLFKNGEVNSKIISHKQKNVNFEMWEQFEIPQWNEKRFEEIIKSVLTLLHWGA